MTDPKMTDPKMTDPKMTDPNQYVSAADVQRAALKDFNPPSYPQWNRAQGSNSQRE